MTGERLDVFREMLLIEAQALKRTFSIHPQNSDVRKFISIVLALTWGVITVGIAFGFADATPTYGILTAVIWAIVGRLWNINVGQIRLEKLEKNDDEK